MRRRRHGRHRDALLARRLAGARRRPDVHRLAQPEGVHGRQARRARRRRAVGRRAASARSASWSTPASATARAAARTRTSTSTPTSRRRPAVHRPGRDQAAEGRRRRRQRHGRADGRPAARAARPRPRDHLLGARRRASPTTSRTRCCQENRQFIIDKVRAEGADLGIAWDGDADRCFFIDDTGTFVDGDFLTALLAESILEKQPGADILYDVRASRAVPDTVARLGGTAHVNRVGHAFFKRRMRDEGGAFGGEVSGHYYFADFYNADSGTIPALLILELLSNAGRQAVRAARAAARALLHLRRDQLRGRRPARPRWPRSRRRYGDGEITKLDGISVDYDDWHFNVRPVEHRAAAAPEPREPRLAAGHGAPARRGAGADPLVTADIHCLSIPTPFAVGRVNCYLIEDDPLTLVDTGPELRQGARRARARAGASTATGSRTSSGSSSPTSTSTTSGCVGILARRSGAEVVALDLLAPVIEDFGADAERDDELAEALMLRHGIPRDVVTALRAVSRAFRGWGGERAGRPPARPTARRSSSPTARCRRSTGPGHSPSDTVFWDAASGAADRRRPPDRAHLLQPADLAAARRQVGRARRRPPARAADLHAARCARRARCRSRSCSRATATRSTTTRR